MVTGEKLVLLGVPVVALLDMVFSGELEGVACVGVDVVDGATDELLVVGTLTGILLAEGLGEADELLGSGPLLDGGALLDAGALFVAGVVLVAGVLLGTLIDVVLGVAVVEGTSTVGGGVGATLDGVLGSVGSGVGTALSSLSSSVGVGSVPLDIVSMAHSSYHLEYIRLNQLH